MEVIKINQLLREKVRAFFEAHWGSPQMVISSGVYDCSDLDGYAVLNEYGEITGLITYIVSGHVCEIISLDSLDEGKGIGTLLVQEVEILAASEGCEVLKLVTTNDNLNALKFWQKRGFTLTQVLKNAVEKARKIKPSIPMVGYEGIPIRDEILLEKKIN
jgi:ribosomal protein S18 acetylase RimI-like enzyme